MAALAPSKAELQAFEKKGDLAADALVAKILSKGGPAGDLLTTAREMATLGDPTAEAFFEQVKNMPDWADFAEFEAGRALFNRAQPISLLAFGLGNWCMTFMVPTIAEILLFSKRSETDVRNRLMETLIYVKDVVNGGLKPAAVGFESTLKVRLLHSLIRIKAKESGFWRHDSLPINQAEMGYLATLFRSVAIDTYEKFSIVMSESEIRSFMLLWRYANWLMGVDEALLPEELEGDRAHHQAYLDYFVEPDENSRRLLEAFYEEFSFREPLPLPRFAFEIATRAVMGSKLADKLELANIPFVDVATPAVLEPISNMLKLLTFSRYLPQMLIPVNPLSPDLAGEIMIDRILDEGARGLVPFQARAKK